MSGRASIAGASFLADVRFAAVISAVETGGDVARVVGGAVRNTLMGEPVVDVDIATTARPEAVMERARAAGLKVVPTGLEHGTVTVIAGGRPFEVTTLRSDVQTDGRRAVVAFTDDWLEDAKRRDFTMNALYADGAGHIFDPVGGIDDALARRVRFIGDPQARIREDYLRILRFFRFHARYGDGMADADGLAACRLLRGGLGRLSRERVGGEMRKIVAAVGAVNALVAMADGGILAEVIPSLAPVRRFARVITFLHHDGRAIFDADLALAMLSDAPDALGDALRLSNRERQRIAALTAAEALLGERPDVAGVRLAVYRHGNAVATAALARVAADRGEAVADDLAEVAERWRAPVFPLRAADLIAAGMKPGPELGAVLKEREAAWIAAGYPERA